MKRFTRILGVLSVTLVLVSGVVYACEGGNCDCNGIQVSLDKATENIKASLPTSAVIEKISSTPIAGIYEVLTADGRIIYADSTGQYVFTGNLVDIKNRVNLTKVPEKKIDFSSLPLEDAVKVGTGKRKIAVFTDPDCPYCRKLDKELKTLSGVEVYSFLFPLPMHPEAKGKSVSIWCSKDRATAFDTILSGGKVDQKECDNPVERNLQLGSRIGVNGTPMIILDNGKTIGGYAPVDKIKEALGL